jgi:hypothetical protein
MAILFHETTTFKNIHTQNTVLEEFWVTRLPFHKFSKNIVWIISKNDVLPQVYSLKKILIEKRNLICRWPNVVLPYGPHNVHRTNLDIQAISILAGSTLFKLVISQSSPDFSKRSGTKQSWRTNVWMLSLFQLQKTISPAKKKVARQCSLHIVLVSFLLPDKYSAGMLPRRKNTYGMSCVTDLGREWTSRKSSFELQYMNHRVYIWLEALWAPDHVSVSPSKVKIIKYW